MNASFWDLLKGGVMVTDERAIEAIRRCSSLDTFKAVLSKLGVVIAYAKRLQPRREMIVDGTFTLERDEINYLGVRSRVVKIDVKINDEQHRLILQSHFYLIVSFSGQIVGILNVL